MNIKRTILKNQPVRLSNELSSWAVWERQEYSRLSQSGKTTFGSPPITTLSRQEAYTVQRIGSWKTEQADSNLHSDVANFRPIATSFQCSNYLQTHLRHAAEANIQKEQDAKITNTLLTTIQPPRPQHRKRTKLKKVKRAKSKRSSKRRERKLVSFKRKNSSSIYKVRTSNRLVSI